MAFRLQKEIDTLKKSILSLLTVVEENVRISVNALRKRDAGMARWVIEADQNVDQMEVDLEEECLKILALHQPVANDLRFIISVMKINNDLERISDCAVNIAERAEFLAMQKPVDIQFDFAYMAGKVKDMLKKSISALIASNPKTAYEVCAADDEVDALNREMYTTIEQAVQRNPEDIKVLLHYLGATRTLERIADHATNIAEDIIYMTEGHIVRHHVEDYQSQCFDKDDDQQTV